MQRRLFRGNSRRLRQVSPEALDRAIRIYIVPRALTINQLTSFREVRGENATLASLSPCGGLRVEGTGNTVQVVDPFGASASVSVAL